MVKIANIGFMVDKNGEPKEHLTITVLAESTVAIAIIEDRLQELMHQTAQVCVDCITDIDISVGGE